jgi:outer membrane receptor protein involved in Fe transport
VVEHRQDQRLEHHAFGERAGHGQDRRPWEEQLALGVPVDVAGEAVVSEPGRGGVVGDAGTTEARGSTHRDGVEVGIKVRPLDWLTFTGDFTYTRKAEFVDTGAAIPLAPLWTARADVTVRLPWGLASSLEMRYLGDRFADEDRHHTARGYTLLNWTGRYRYRNLEAFLSVENLPDVHWREAQFFFTSRLPGEPAAGVNDVHFTPGAPRSFLGGIAVHF